MRRFVAVVGLLALALFPVLPARAAGPDVTRPGDGILRFCPAGYKCTARAVGDFNADRMDDLLFEVTRMGLNNSDAGAPRRFDLYLSPYVPDTSPGRDASRDRRGANVVQFFLEGGQSLDPVTVADINADGRADLVFPRAGLGGDNGVGGGLANLRSKAHLGGGADGNLSNDRATVVLGRNSGWGKRYKLDGVAEAAGILHVQGEPTDFDAIGTRPMELSANTVALQSADLNQDGRPDLIMAVDGQFIEVSSRGMASLHQRSVVHVQWGRGALPGRVAFKPDLTVVDLGACNLGLAGVGDVTGDGQADLVLRRCKVAGSPPQLRVLAGRRDWPASITADGIPLGGGPDLVPTPTPIAPEPTEEPPPPSGGYLPSGSGEVTMPAQVRLQDVSGDGVLDIALEFAGKTHLWFGGPAIVDRVATSRTHGAYLKAGYGALPLTRSWRTVDLDADGRKDLLLSKSIDPALLQCPAGACQATVKPDANGRPVYLYTGAHATRRVVDLELDTADAVWNDPANVIWALGDFNADSKDDLLMGSSPGAFDSVYTLVFGPIAAAKAP
jgi:hypothetical protein